LRVFSKPGSQPQVETPCLSNVAHPSGNCALIGCDDCANPIIFALLRADQICRAGNCSATGNLPLGLRLEGSDVRRASERAERKGTVILYLWVPPESVPAA
jgi:hypothetical protein